MRRSGLLVAAFWCLAAAALLPPLAAAQTTPLAEPDGAAPDGQPAASAAPASSGSQEQEIAALYADLTPVSASVGDVGSGRAEVVLQLLPDGSLANGLWRVQLQGVQEATKAHVHQGQPGESGPVVLVLTPAGAAKVGGPARAHASRRAACRPCTASRSLPPPCAEHRRAAGAAEWRHRPQVGCSSSLPACARRT